MLRGPVVGNIFVRIVFAPLPLHFCLAVCAIRANASFTVLTQGESTGLLFLIAMSANLHIALLASSVRLLRAILPEMPLDRVSNLRRAPINASLFRHSRLCLG